MADVTIVYTDLVESTELNVKVGDDQFLELLHEHNEIVRRRLKVFNGVEFTHTGDGIGARFSESSNAVRFALGLQADFDDANTTHPSVAFLVRVGVARGEAMLDTDNMFGQTVTRAARICAAASGGQVLAGEELTTGTDPMVASFSAAGAFALKGFGISIPLFEAGPAEVAPVAG